MYPEELVAPMRNELTEIGFKECNDGPAVDQLFSDNQGTVLLVVNSVCGCAAGSARPGVKMAVEQSQKRPAQLATVFAGVDKEATDKAREYLAPYPPSSPSVGLFKDGQLVHMVERHHIEGNSPEAIGKHLAAVFDEFC